jgi:Protein of unknown function (DUF3168)
MIKIGKAIYSLISGDSTISGYVNTKIFPMVAPEETQLPLIIYERSGTIDPHTKDGTGICTAEVVVTVVSSDYESCINIAQAVNDVLTSAKGIYGENHIFEIILKEVKESISLNAFLQHLTYECKCL